MWRYPIVKVGIICRTLLVSVGSNLQKGPQVLGGEPNLKQPQKTCCPP